MKEISRFLIKQILIFFLMLATILPFIYMIADADYIMINFTRPFLPFPNYIVTTFYDDEIPGNNKYHVAMYNMKANDLYELVYMQSYPDHKKAYAGYFGALELSHQMYPHFECYFQNHQEDDPTWHTHVHPTCFRPRMTPLVRAAEIIARNVMEARAVSAGIPRERVRPPVPRFDQQIPVYEPPSQQAMQEANRAIFPPDYSEFPDSEEQ